MFKTETDFGLLIAVVKIMIRFVLSLTLILTLHAAAAPLCQQILSGLERTGVSTAKIQLDSASKNLLGEFVRQAQVEGYSQLYWEISKQSQDIISLATASGFEKTVEVHRSNPDILIFRKTFEVTPAQHRLRTREAKAEYFNKLHQLLLKNKDRLREILLQVETERGADYELRQVEDLLKNAAAIELPNLQRIKPLKNVAVYGSTNIPLYTLMMHAFLPLTVSEKVWFRTPKATREIYQALFDALAMQMPPETFSGLNLLTENRDVQYENFRKLHVMGMNLKGNKFVRDPSEVVLFTGSPETGRQVLAENVEKLRQLGQGLKHEQAFLMFGAGMNPLIVTKSAGGQLKPAVTAALDSILINSGQDCIAPNFLLVDEAVSDRFISELKTSLSQIRVSKIEKGPHVISPLSFSESIQGLTEYSNTYRRNLVNPAQASVHVETKSVTPHLFVFSGKDFHRVPLKEHFAPFLVIFKYKNLNELEYMLKDARVQNKVMYASVFGSETATPEVSHVVKILQENRHTVSVNDSVYADESGNMAFGGLGPDSSSITIIKNSNGKIKTETAQRPLLFSEEAARHFAPVVRTEVSTPTTLEARKQLKNLLSSLDRSPQDLPPMLYGHEKLQQPLAFNRTTGLKYLRSMIQKHGLFRVMNGPAPQSPAEVRAAEFFNGSPLVYTHQESSIRYQKGVALHVSSPGEGALLLNKIRGEVNPHLARGRLTGLLDGNKKLEYFLAEAIQPGIMPASETMASLKSERIFSPEVESRRISLHRKISALRGKGRILSVSDSAELRAEVAQHVQSIFSAVRKKFPQGAYFKNFADYSTADLGIQITTFSSNPAHIAQQFVLRLNQLIKDRKTGRLAQLMQENVYETGSKFVSHLLENPDPIIVQVKEEIAKTTQGINKEFRVDFIDGEPFFSKLRFSREFYPEDAVQAEMVLREFFQKAPPELKHLSGGADVAQLRDGRWIIIEFNFGSSSGTLMPEIFIMDNHEAVSRIQGYDTPLLRQLKEIAGSGPESAREYFRNLRRHTEPWNKYSIEDLSAVEFGKWYRDQLLAEWKKRPTASSGQELLAHLRFVLFSREKIGEDLQKIYDGAVDFIERSER